MSLSSLFTRKVIIEHRSSETLTDGELEELWAVYAPHHNMTHAEFVARLRTSMDGIAIYRHPRTRAVVGLTGMRRQELVLPSGQRALAIYSGGSYVEPAFRGLHLLQRFLAWHILRWRLRNPLGRAYIWFDALSFKTYMIATRNTYSYFPSRHWQTPPDMLALMRRLGESYYGALYDPETHAIPKEQRRLKAHVAPIGQGELADPDIAFYVRCNPGHAQGDGLLTVIPFTLVNLSATMLRGLWKQLRPSRARKAPSAGQEALNPVEETVA